MTVGERRERIEKALAALVDRETVKDWDTTEEFGVLIGKAEFTVPEHCRLGRLNAQKRQSGTGAHPGWVLSHQELLRYRQYGLLPRLRRAWKIAGRTGGSA